MTASVITLFVSAIYNEAIATSNSELISNGVIILFITDLDEMIFDIVVTISPNWIQEEEGDDGNNEACTREQLRQLEQKNSELENKNVIMENELNKAKDEMARLWEKMESIQNRASE